MAQEGVLDEFRVQLINGLASTKTWADLGAGAAPRAYPRFLTRGSAAPVGN